MKSNRLFTQSAIRIGAMGIVRMIGLLGRVTLTRLVGAEGIGLYQIAYSFFGLILTVTGGVPTAFALATARMPNKSWTLLFRVAFYLLLTGTLTCLLMLGNSRNIAEWIGNPGLYYAIQSLSPALLLVPVLGLLRGYLQGNKSIEIIAVSEIIEQAFRYAVMLAIVVQLLPLGVEHAIGYGLYGSTAGAAAAILLLAGFLVLRPSPILQVTRDKQEVLSPVWFIRTSLAISATRLFIPLSEFIDSIIVPARLAAAGHDAAEATAIYGVVYGMAIIIVYAPTLVTGAISHTFSVQLAAAWQDGNHTQFLALCRTSLCSAWLWGGGCGLFCFVFADELSGYIFSTDSAAAAIRYLSPVPLIVGLRELTTSILWARDIRKPPFLGLFTGLVCSITAQYFLLAIPGFEYKGASAAVLCLEVIACAVNGWTLVRVLRPRVSVKPLLCDLSTLLAGGLWLMLVGGGTETTGLWRLLGITFCYFAAVGTYIYCRCVRNAL